RARVRERPTGFRPSDAAARRADARALHSRARTAARRPAPLPRGCCARRPAPPRRRYDRRGSRRGPWRMVRQPNSVLAPAKRTGFAISRKRAAHARGSSTDTNTPTSVGVVAPALHRADRGFEFLGLASGRRARRRKEDATGLARFELEHAATERM